MFFLKYLNRRKKIIFAALLFFVIFAASFYLYHLPVEAVVYPALVCIVITGIFAAVDFIKEVQRHKIMTKILKIGADMTDELPEPRNIGEEDYRAIIRALLDDSREKSAEFSAKYRDMVEYYTMWAHQIKTPITSMRLSLENEDTALSRKLSADLFQIERYVEMVMAFLRLNSKANDYVFKEYSLDGIISQAISKFASDFILKKIRLDYTPSGKTAVTDEKWLSFVVGQILSNALKYTQSGEIKIYVREPKILCIEDTGAGIDPSDLPRVFEMGYTGCNGRKDKRASGIGLFLCRKICQRLNIGISISSKPEEGTIVCLDLEQYELKKE